MHLKFGQPLFLLLFAIVLLLWLRERFWQDGRASMPLPLALRLLILSLLTLGLAQAEVALPHRGQTILFVVDGSNSMLPEQQEQAFDFLAQAVAEKQAQDSIGLIVFAGHPTLQQHPTPDFAMPALVPAEDPDATNLAAALDFAKSQLPPSGLRRVVLVSDGHENRGHVDLSLAAFKESGIPVDVVRLAAVNKGEVLLDALLVPETVQIGEEFPLTISIRSSHPATGHLHLYVDGVATVEEYVELQPGYNRFRYWQQHTAEGFYRYRARIVAQPDTWSINNTAEGYVVVQGEPRTLIVNQDSSLTQLQSVLTTAEVVSPQGFPDTLAELQVYNAVVLNDIATHDLTRRQMQTLQSYVGDYGGGLLVIGGRRSFGSGDYSETPLEAILPVRSQIEQRLLFPSFTLLIVLDKSGSMGDGGGRRDGFTKMDLAKEATAALVDLLVPGERIGVIAFDSTPQEVVPIQDAEHRRSILQGIARIAPGGGTRIYPALVSAYEAISAETSAVRHIVLLSDGISEEGDYPGIVGRMVDGDISLSTVGIGHDADHQLMQQLAALGGGRYYFTTDADTIYQILATEASRVVRPPIAEGTFQPLVLGESLLTASISWDHVPPFYGYAVTTPRHLTDVFLITPDRSPLLASWRYGLGRSAVFTADAGEEWLRDWTSWDDISTFWQRLLNWVARNPDPDFLGVAVHSSGDTATVIVDAIDQRGTYMNFLDLEGIAIHPDGSRQVFPIDQIAPGRYEGVFAAPQVGAYVVHVGVAGSVERAATGVVVPFSPEYRDTGVNEELWQRVATATGGRILATPDELLATRPIGFSEPIPISWWLVLAALLLFLVDVAVRTVRWSNVRGVLVFLVSSINKNLKVAHLKAQDYEHKAKRDHNR